MYVDGLVEILSTSGIGCHIKNLFLSIPLYTDDMALVAPSLKGLQRLLAVTENYCDEWDILLNPKKSKNMIFGKSHFTPPKLHLDGKSLEWVEKWRYLGVVLKAHKEFNCCIEDKLKAFYRSTNAILRIEGRSNELVMSKLLESHRVSILTYGIEVTHVDNSNVRRKLRVAHNTIFRQILHERISNRSSASAETSNMGRTA